MDPAKQRRDIGQFLAQLLPLQVLRDAHSLALSFEREELFRRYALKRMWLIIPAALVFAVVSAVCALTLLIGFRDATTSALHNWNVDS